MPEAAPRRRDLSGQVSVVTGAGKGIGRAVAQRLAAEGAAVVAADVDERSAEATVGLLQGPGGGRAFGADVSRDDDVRRLFEMTIAAFGRVDIVCNNAAIMDRMMPVDELDPKLWERVIAVNLTGPFLVSHHALPHMLSAGGGTIVNIGSIAALRGGVSGAAYTASKHGLIGLTRNLAWMYAERGIRACAICPGGVRTGISMGGEMSTFGLGRVRAAGPLEMHRGEPEEIAELVCTVALADTALINGAVLAADGGWQAN